MDRKNVWDIGGKAFLSFQQAMVNETFRFCDGGYCWPRIFIIGAAKSSTTSLWAVLRTRGVSMCVPSVINGDPKWYRKEGTFYNINENFLENGVAIEDRKLRYSHRYPDSNCMKNDESYYVEATPSYLWHPFVPKRLHIEYNSKLNGNLVYLNKLKFIALLREPVSRDLSWYSVGEGIQTTEWWDKMKNTCGQNVHTAADCYDKSVKTEIYNWNQCIQHRINIICNPSSNSHHERESSSTSSMKLHCPLMESKNINTYIISNALHHSILLDVYEQCYTSSRLSHGMYAAQLLMWIRVWNRQQILILKSSTLQKSSEDIIRRVAQHLDIVINMTEWIGMPHENDTGQKKQYLAVTPFCSTIKHLQEFYQPYNDILMTVLKRTEKISPKMEPRFLAFKSTELPHCK